MLFFGKKKSEEEFDDEEEMSPEEELRDRRLTRKFRDLNPEDRKRRKEPPKPWGKKERYTVFIIFLLTTICAAILFLYSHDYKFPGLPKLTINGFNIKNPFAEEIIEIGQKKVAPKYDRKAGEATALFEQEIKPVAGFYGFLVIRLGDGSSYGVSTDAKFQGASLLKFPLLVLMYRLNEEGSLNLETKYTLKDADKVKGAGILYSAKAGTVYSLRQLAEYLGKNSDRTAYKVIKDIVTEEAFSDFLIKMNMKSTDINTGVTTPGDIGHLFQDLWEAKIVTDDNRNEILGYLTNTVYEKWITAGVPKGIIVAHKFGQDEGVMADGGIIFSGSPYVLVIMGNGITQHDADLLFPKISKDIYNVENGVQ